MPLDKNIQNKIKHYIEDGGEECLYCNDFKPVVGEFNNERNIAWVTVTCLNCEGRWDEVYEMTRIDTTPPDA